MRRVQFVPGFVLHHTAYRDTSRIVELYTRDFGRLTAFARGVRGPKPRLGSALQPFSQLLLSWSGRGEAVQLTGAERRVESMLTDHPLPPASLMSGYYLNELLIKLTTRHDPMAAVFDDYVRALESLRRGELAPALRRFEKRLLEHLGYGLDLQFDALNGEPVRSDGCYRLRAGEGLVPVQDGDANAVAGASLLAMAAERFDAAAVLEDARRLLGASIEHLLEGRELSTRLVARSMLRRTRSLAAE